MDGHSDGHDTATPRLADEEDPDSSGRSSFFARLFRRDSDEDDEDGAEGGSAADSARAADMLVNLRNMRTLRVDDVSVPRADIVAVPDDASLADLVEVFQGSTNSRLPVFHETLDQPLGLIHLKDLALRYGFGSPSEAFDLRGLIRPLLYAPPSMPIGVLLHKMQTARSHMALVIDEYGGVDGLVTIEDLLEQIVGDIADEHDEAESQLWLCEAPGVYVVQARMDLDDFQAATGIALVSPGDDEEIDTFGGLVFRLVGRVPERGEVVGDGNGHEFEVLDADARRIKRLRVRLGPGGAGSPHAAAAE